MSDSSIASRSRPPAINYLEDPVVSKFYAVKECIAHYLGLHDLCRMRDCHAAILVESEAFFHASSDADGERLVDAVLAASRQRPLREGDGNCDKSPSDTGQSRAVWEQARELCPQGLALLDLSPPLTRDQLKRSYRQAALKYHPDAGGSHDQMVVVNEAFDLCSRLLDRGDAGKSDIPSDTTIYPRVIKARDIDFLRRSMHWRISTNSERAEDCHEFRCGVGLLLLSIAVDDWRLDDAIAWLRRLREPRWMPRQSDDARNQTISMGPAALTLAARLIAAQKQPEANEAFDSATCSDQRAYQRAHEIISGKRRPVFHLRHQRQVESAFRLGVIGRDRYTALLRKLDAKGRESCKSACPAMRIMHVPPIGRYPSGEGFTANESRYVFPEARMNPQQRAFFWEWRRCWEAGDVVDVGGMVSYLVCFAQIVLGQGPTKAVPELKRLIIAYEHEATFARRCQRWLSDCHVAACDYRAAIASFPSVPLGSRDRRGADCLLSLRTQYGGRLCASDALALGRSKITKWGVPRSAAIADALDRVLREYEDRNSANILQLGRSTSPTRPYMLFESLLVRRIADIPLFAFSENKAFIHLLGELTRIAEDSVRLQMGAEPIRSTRRNS